ncbi:Clavaminate synthase-like protein [Lentinula boryana]|uniref:Clavaminate synthase-like protein n=1 Tax=Lentinula boryana TaxID=40481 RepID=A0ABQ8Q3V9_9AGAR|nr:Clavaminate synthase-like protein [Lentinula boryana]
MPSLTVPLVPHYQLAPETKEARFFYLIGHGYSKEQYVFGRWNACFDIADVPFSQVGDQEKERYLASMKQARSYQGYKLRQFWVIFNGLNTWDVLDSYISTLATARAHPEALRPLLPEIDQFARHSHMNVLSTILKLMALGLELPEETLLDMHSAEDEEKTKNVWLKIHNDIGTITLLYSQPVSALQICDITWKWMKHIENAIVLSYSQPPDQHTYTRLGIFYFCMANDDVKLAPLVASPVLQRLGIKRRFERDEDAPEMAEWRKARTAAYGQSVLSKSTEERDVEQ